jgi:kumamolisin
MHATLIGHLSESEKSATAEITVLVRRRNSARSALASESASARTARRAIRHIAPGEFVDSYGADPADLAAVARFGTVRHLTVVSTDPARRTVVLRGPLAALSAAFGVELSWYDWKGSRYRGHEQPVRVPNELAGVVEGAFGLDDLPRARPHVRPATAAAAPSAQLTAADVAGLYQFPSGLDGGGQCVGLIELGGGYLETDLRTYASALGLPAIEVTVVPVDGAANTPPTGEPDSSDAEVALDLQVLAGMAPAAKLAVYFAPNSDRGFLDVISTAVHDTAHRPSVVSISWGAPEVVFPAQVQQAFNEILADAALLGVTVCCSTGDLGSAAGETDGRAHVELPASSPYALACGGTYLTVNGKAIVDEVVWQDGTSGSSGGGISDVFDLPDWQRAANVPHSANPDARVGRGIPDVAGNADFATAYRIVVGGAWNSVGGTSAVAPLIAGLVARGNQRLGRRIGWLNPVLYHAKSDAGIFRPITRGTNGAYRAGPGWNACTGLGVPNGSRLLNLLAALPSPGEPKPG